MKGTCSPTLGLESRYCTSSGFEQGALQRQVSHPRCAKVHVGSQRQGPEWPLAWLSEIGALGEWVVGGWAVVPDPADALARAPSAARAARVDGVHAGGGGDGRGDATLPALVERQHGVCSCVLGCPGTYPRKHTT